jgi:hypothetical protein
MAAFIFFWHVPSLWIAVNRIESTPQARPNQGPNPPISGSFNCSTQSIHPTFNLVRSSSIFNRQSSHTRGPRTISRLPAYAYSNSSAMSAHHHSSCSVRLFFFSFLYIYIYIYFHFFFEGGGGVAFLTLQTICSVQVPLIATAPSRSCIILTYSHGVNYWGYLSHPALPPPSARLPSSPSFIPLPSRHVVPLSQRLVPPSRHLVPRVPRSVFLVPYPIRPTSNLPLGSTQTTSIYIQLLFASDDSSYKRRTIVSSAERGARGGAHPRP